MKEALRLIGRFIGHFIYQVVMFVVGSVILTGSIMAITWYFYGETIIISSVDGKEIKGGLVEIDGQYAGDTPLVVRIPAGYHTITVLPPEDPLTNEAEMSWSLVSWGVEGQHLNARFTEMTDEDLEELTNSATLLIPGN